MSLLLDREEHEALLHAWDFLQASGHATCGGWTRDSGDPAGWLQCACGEALIVPEAARPPAPPATSPADGASGSLFDNDDPEWGGR